MKILNLLIAILCISFLSCGNNSPASTAFCSADFSVEFQDELTAISNASSAYGQDPSPANCQNFKTAYLSYIEALEDWEECATINNSVAEFKAALDDARASVDDIEC